MKGRFGKEKMVVVGGDYHGLLSIQSGTLATN